MSAFLNPLTRLRKASLFLSEFFWDFVSYVRFSGVSPFQGRDRKLGYKIIIEAHAIEKGLSLVETRPFFGEAKIRFIMRALSRYDQGLSSHPVDMAVGAFEAYVAFHRERGLSGQVLDEIDNFIVPFLRQGRNSRGGGLRHYPNGISPVNHEPRGFIASRFSCRIFAPDLVGREIAEKIVSLAQTCPSQCNRQSTMVHFYQDAVTIGKLLKLQAGSVGFSESVKNLFVVSFELAAWGGAQQRNQGYVDGALFSMNLMLAAHAAGLVSCPLNLAVTHAVERHIRGVGGIPSDQRLVMMIALGFPRAGPIKAARSPRRPVAEILRFADSGS